MSFNKYTYIAGAILVIGMAIIWNYREQSSPPMMPPENRPSSAESIYTESPSEIPPDETSNKTTDNSDIDGELPPMQIKNNLDQNLMMLGAKLKFLLGDQLTQDELNQLSLDLYSLLDAFSEYASDRTTEIERGKDGVVYQFLMTEHEVEEWRSKCQSITESLSGNNDQASINDYLFNNFTGIRTMNTITPHIFIVNQDSDSKTRVFHEYTDNLSAATFNKVHAVENFNKQFFGNLISGINEH